MTIADKIVRIQVGRIEQIGIPDQGYDRLANRYVADYIGSPTITLLPGEIGPAGRHVATGQTPGRAVCGVYLNDLRLAGDGPATGRSMPPRRWPRPPAREPNSSLALAARNSSPWCRAAPASRRARRSALPSTMPNHTCSTPPANGV